MRGEIRRIQRDTGITTVFVTHDQAEALTMSDRIVVLSKGRVMQIGAPTEVYENPSNTFVAEFIGEANFFDGTVVASDTTEMVISLGPLTVRAPANADVAVGRSASFSVRPERLRIQPRHVAGTSACNVYEATVEDHDYLGAVVRYYLRLADGLSVKVDEHNVAGIRHRSGEAVALEIPPDDCFVLPRRD